jgi:hypothetical protein
MRSAGMDIHEMRELAASAELEPDTGQVEFIGNSTAASWVRNAEPKGSGLVVIQPTRNLTQWAQDYPPEEAVTP